MDNKRFYVPNVQKWIKYYQKRINDPIMKSGYVGKQVGGSLSGGEGTFIVPIEDETVENKNSNPVKLTLVSPTQQVVEQAKAELVAAKKGTKRMTSNKSVSKRRKRRTVKKVKKKGVKRLKNKIKVFRRVLKSKKPRKAPKKTRRVKKITGNDIFST